MLLVKEVQRFPGIENNKKIILAEIESLNYYSGLQQAPHSFISIQQTSVSAHCM